MKNERLLNSMNLLDEKYIDEANPKNKKIKKKINWLKFGLLAACICLMVTALNLYLFIPFSTQVPDVSEYSDSEYFPIIEKLNALSAVKPKYKNNFDKILSSFAGMGTNFAPTDKDGDLNYGVGDGIINDSTSNGSNAENVEFTDNQVEGVYEGDIIKRTDTHIFYLTDFYIDVYSIDGENSKNVCYHNFSFLPVNIPQYTNKEMYISEDGNTLTLVSMYQKSTKKYDYGTAIFSIDISDVENIALKSYALIDGNLISSRMVDGTLLVFSKVTYDSVNYSNTESFVPSCDNGTDKTFVPMANIVCSENIRGMNYTVVTMFDENTLELKDSSAFLSYSNDIYVTNNAVYATRNTNGTEISCIAYSDDGFEVKGTIKVNGYIKDRYSIDEYNGILRVVTTTRDAKNGTSASLYCIDINTWEVVASVLDFAPYGETVKSVRYDKEYAYVCTAVVIVVPVDPVYFFDLSDLDNITYKDTGEIEGYSTSLINFGNGYLLGIGVGSSMDNVKIEIYKECENKVVSVCSYEIKNATYSEDYKAYYVDRTNQLFGFGIKDSENHSSRYILLHFGNGELIKLVDEELSGGNDDKRAVCIDGYLYMIGNMATHAYIKVVKVLC